MHIKKLFTLFLCFCSTLIIGQNNFLDSVLNLPVAQIYSLTHLDSIVKIWSVDKSMIGLKPNSVLNFQEFSDKVYKERLKEIEMHIPLTYNPKVKSFIEIYTIEKRHNVEILLGLFENYDSIFVKALSDNRLPKELKYFPLIKSALNPSAVSPSGASGLWQFTYPTAKYYNLYIDSYIDERRDYQKSTYAAIQVLKNLHEIYNDWTMALAAYNCGPGNVNKAIRRSGGKTKFWEIYPWLPEEARDYVPAYIAMVYVANYYPEHNLTPYKIELQIAPDTVRVTEKLHLQQVADVLQLPIEQVRELNPIFKHDVIPHNGRQYFLSIPASYKEKFVGLQDSIYAYKDSILFNISKPIEIKTYAKNTYKSRKSPKDLSEVYYTVKSGDNLGLISNWYNVSVNDIMYWNGLHSSRINIGQSLVIYVANDKVKYYKAVNGLSYARKQARIGKTAESEPKKETTDNNSNSSGNDWIYYTVKSGDSPYGIAQKYEGVSEDDIMKLNDISNPRSLKIGQKLKIKRK
ncbi:MAG: LysM peptidoglycan-binding domain-containing protein [Saprospiraceae bacterium]|nr:LysM peptidoglycan-binding domain-containing protein [Saprospiraceae bacterium]